MNRKEFILGAAAMAGVAGCKSSCPICGCGGSRPLFGTAIWDLKLTKDVAAAGYDFYDTTVAIAFNPNKDDEWWKGQKEMMLAQPLPMRSALVFMPSTIRLTGPKADFEPALEYGLKAMRRADEIGVDSIVFGSSAARNAPGDMTNPNRKLWAKPEEAQMQFVDFCRELAKRSEGMKVQIVLEPLRRNEDNVLNYVWEGVWMCEEINSPRIQLLADMYHMLSGREDPESIVKAAKYLKHCHVATYKTRRFPGSEGEENLDKLQPYFDALNKIGYTGGISIEGAWENAEKTIGGVTPKNLEKALLTMKRLARVI